MDFGQRGVILTLGKVRSFIRNHIYIVRKLLFAGSAMNNTLYMKYESQN